MKARRTPRPLLSQDLEEREETGDTSPAPPLVIELQLFPWLQDANQAARGTLIDCDEGLWARAEEFPQSIAQKLANAGVHDWENDGENDLACFIQLPNDRVSPILSCQSSVTIFLITNHHHAANPLPH